MATIKLNPHRVVLHKHIIFVGSFVMVLIDHKGITEAEYRMQVKVLALKPNSALLAFPDGEKLVPYEKLTLCRKETDKIDSMGYPIDLNDGVTISSYGGAIAHCDVGSRGVVEKLNAKTAKVRFHTDYAKVKNIPYNYLRK